MLAPLEGVRVLNLGGLWPSRVASLVMADQGADVIEINAPNAPVRSEDALLGRGKQAITLDYKSKEGRALAFELARDADIIFDGLGFRRAEKYGLDYAGISSVNKDVIYVSMPGFASTSPEADLPAWEGAIDASVGVYTDVHIMGPIIGGAPKFTAIPMASAYGGVHAAIAASMGYLHRLRSGQGQFIEVPLADAVMSAMALLAIEVEGQPQRFDIPAIDRAMREVAFPILRDLADHLTPEHRGALEGYLGTFIWPGFNAYPCADGRWIFINAIEHVRHARACLDVLGLQDEMIAEGLVIGTPYDESGAENNVNLATLSREWKDRLKAAFGVRFRTRPAAEWEERLGLAGVPASMVRTAAEWLKLPFAIQGGNVCALEDPVVGKTHQSGRFVSIDGKEMSSPSVRPRRLENLVNWSHPKLAPRPTVAENSEKGILSGFRVLDLSNAIAGPVAARVFGEFGAEIIKIEAPAPFAGPRMTVWFGLDVNQGKKALLLDLKSAEGRKIFHRLVSQSDILLHNYLDGTAERMGISPDQLKKVNPDIITCQVSAWAGPDGGPRKEFQAFDPVIQSATGIAARYGSAQAPVLHGWASCVDYITGFIAASGVAHALIARQLGRGRSHVRTSLSMGAQLVQFPFMVDSDIKAVEPSGQSTVGYGPHQRVYKAADGWVYLGSRPDSISDVARCLGAVDSSEAALSKALATMTMADAGSRVREIYAAAIVPVKRLDKLRESCRIDRDAALAGSPVPPSIAMVRDMHPSGYNVTLPLPTWYRMGRTPVQWLDPAGLPGSDGESILRDFGLADAEIEQLVSDKVVRKNWAVLKNYLPL